MENEVPMIENKPERKMGIDITTNWFTKDIVVKQILNLKMKICAVFNILLIKELIIESIYCTTI